AMQSLPTIRMIQANNQALIDKFHTIREITVPAWKRQFMLAITLNEQQNAVQLATHIDDTTNDLLKRNADLLHRNSVETARANQRRSEEHTSELQSRENLVCRLLLEKKKKQEKNQTRQGSKDM